MVDHFGSQGSLRAGDREYGIFRLAAVERAFSQAARLPFSLKILLENLLRAEDGVSVRPEDVEGLAKWDPKARPSCEIAFMPSRVLMQDFTGVPAIVDLAAMRDAMLRMGGAPRRINPLQPAELVIDHSVQVDEFGGPLAFQANADLELARNRERYAFLRWGQKAFRNFKVVPPDTGIVHQVNLEYLARVVFVNESVKPRPLAYPDTLVGTDSHTTMINGLGVLGWGVGGIEAEAAMLGQPVSMLIPEVVGFRLTGRLPEGATATDLVLTVTEMLRKKGVVGKFVEFFGAGLAGLPLADRATIANMAPEYGATCGIFPVDAETLRYLRFTGRPEQQVQLVEAYTKEQGLFHTPNTPEAAYSETLSLDLDTIEPSIAGPRRPQDRIRLRDAGKAWGDSLQSFLSAAKAGKAMTQVPGAKAFSTGLHIPDPTTRPQTAQVEDTLEKAIGELRHGSVVIAAITSCTNTSNPSVMLAAGILARKAVERGLQTKPWVKTSLAPGSKVVTDYLIEAGVMRYLEQLRFHLVGYGCTTCLAEGTPVLLANGTARRIEQMPNAGGAVLFSPTPDSRLGLAMQAEAMTKGVRDCVTLVLQDGRELVCTPDHEILCAGGRWVRADQLELGRDRVVAGLEAPLDEPGPDEAGYTLTVGNQRLTMGAPQERLRTLAFARLLGYLLGNGSSNAAKQGRMHVSRALDCEMVLNDIELLTGKRPAATHHDEGRWTIALPAALTAAIAELPGVRSGRRIDQPPSLPALVLHPRCPVAVVREFLGGVFGAAGQVPTLHRDGEQSTDGALEPPAYSQTARSEHVEQLESVMSELLRLLARCGTRTDGANVQKFFTSGSASSYAPGLDGSPLVAVHLELPDGLSFVERVGFRYSVDKALRATAAAVYWRMTARINRQRQKMSAALQEVNGPRADRSSRQAHATATVELCDPETIVSSPYSLLEGHERFDRLPQAEDRSFRPLHPESCGFPSPVELFEELGVGDWFAPLLSRATMDPARRDCAEKTSETLPTFALRVLDRRAAGERLVFDLSVEGSHAFVASTACVHNCIGNSGPLPVQVSQAIEEGNLVVAAVLSGNRNFEGRVHPEVRANYLASPPLVVAYALAGRMDVDLFSQPLGHDPKGQPVYLRDIWPTQQEVQEAIERSVHSEMFHKEYSEAFLGDAHWNALPVPEGECFNWDAASTYVRHPPYFEGMTPEPVAAQDIRGARVLALLGDSITTDHISPAGSIKAQGPAGRYLMEHGVQPKDFNSYGSRRGNHEVMVRGTFANVRLRNLLAPGTEGGVTRHLPEGTQMSIYDASVNYREEGVPLVVLAGKEYGSGSSRDWAAKGPLLLGIRAVIAESYERIHRSNLVGMGILPLQFLPGESAASLGLTGEEVYDVVGLAGAVADGFAHGREITVCARSTDGKVREFRATVRIDTPQEIHYYRHGGILQYVLRQLLAQQ